MRSVVVGDTFTRDRKHGFEAHVTILLNEVPASAHRPDPFSRSQLNDLFIHTTSCMHKHESDSKQTNAKSLPNMSIPKSAGLFDAASGFEILPSDSTPKTSSVTERLDFFHQSLCNNIREFKSGMDDLEILHKHLRTRKEHSSMFSEENPPEPNLYYIVSGHFFQGYDERNPEINLGISLYKTSAIECASARAAVRYFKSFKESKILRRFKHLSFSTRAMYGGSENDHYWNRLSDYLTNKLSIETVDLFLPLDSALSTVEKDPRMMRCLSKYGEVFDWEILELFSHRLAEGTIKRLRICYTFQSLDGDTTIDQLYALRCIKSYAAAKFGDLVSTSDSAMSSGPAESKGTALDPILIHCEHGTKHPLIYEALGIAKQNAAKDATSVAENQRCYLAVAEVENVAHNRGLIITLERRTQSKKESPRLSFLGL